MQNDSAEHELHAFVVRKLTKVFGEQRTPALLADVLGQVGLARIASDDDLARVADALQQRGGFEATAGAMLAVQVAMRRIAAR